MKDVKQHTQKTLLRYDTLRFTELTFPAFSFVSDEWLPSTSPPPYRLKFPQQSINRGAKERLFRRPGSPLPLPAMGFSPAAVLAALLLVPWAVAARPLPPGAQVLPPPSNRYNRGCNPITRCRCCGNVNVIKPKSPRVAGELSISPPKPPTVAGELSVSPPKPPTVAGELSVSPPKPPTVAGELSVSPPKPPTVAGEVWACENGGREERVARVLILSL